MGLVVEREKRGRGQGGGCGDSGGDGDLLCALEGSRGMGISCSTAAGSKAPSSLDRARRGPRVAFFRTLLRTRLKKMKEESDTRVFFFHIKPRVEMKKKNSKLINSQKKTKKTVCERHLALL